MTERDRCRTRRALHVDHACAYSIKKGSADGQPEHHNLPMSDRRVRVIAGPNGAGNATFARAFLLAEAHCPNFIIADLIAAGLSPLSRKRRRCAPDG